MLKSLFTSKDDKDVNIAESLSDFITYFKRMLSKYLKYK